MTNGIVTLPRAGTVEVIQEFGGAAASPARPVLSVVVIGSSFQIESQLFAGFYEGRTQVLDELVGTGNGATTEFQLDEDDILADTVDLRVGSITGTALVASTDFTVDTSGTITLTPSGVAALGVEDLHAAYFFAPAQAFIYPQIKQGAEIQSPGTDVSVFLKTVEDVFEITNGFGVIAGSTTVTVPGNIQPERDVTTAHGQVEILATTSEIVDISLDFNALGVRPGDVLRFITDAAELQFSDSVIATDGVEHTVLTIPTANSLTIDPDVADQGGLVEYEVVRQGSQNGEIQISYRARRSDKEGILQEFEDVQGVEDELGPIQPDNPLAFGLLKVLGATDRTVFSVMVEDQDSIVDHQKALDFLEGEEIYFLVPLTSDAAIHQVYERHAANLSDPESMRERRVIVTTKTTTRRTFQNILSTGAVAVGSAVFTDPNANFLANGVPIGSVIKLSSPETIELADVERTELIINGIISNTQVNLIQTVTQGTLIEQESVGTGTGAQTIFQLANTSNVISASVVMFVAGVQIDQSDFTATSGGVITFLTPPALGDAVTADYELDFISGVTYTVESQELTNFEIAQDVAAVGQAFGSRRITVTHADSVDTTEGTTVEPFFLNAALAGLFSAVPANQPIANVPIPGFTRINHLRKFSEIHFGIMAAGGISVFIQDRDTSPIILRNSITTDTTNVNTRENSIVQMADFYAKFLRRNVEAIAGRFNITRDFIDNMLRPGINGVNRELETAGLIGPRTSILSIEQSTVTKDQLFVLIELELFAPANRITITVRIL